MDQSRQRVALLLQYLINFKSLRLFSRIELLSGLCPIDGQGICDKGDRLRLVCQLFQREKALCAGAFYCVGVRVLLCRSCRHSRVFHGTVLLYNKSRGGCESNHSPRGVSALRGALRMFLVCVQGRSALNASCTAGQTKPTCGVERSFRIQFRYDGPPVYRNFPVFSDRHPLFFRRHRENPVLRREYLPRPGTAPGAAHSRWASAGGTSPPAA